MKRKEQLPSSSDIESMKTDREQTTRSRKENYQDPAPYQQYQRQYGSKPETQYKIQSDKENDDREELVVLQEGDKLELDCNEKDNINEGINYRWTKVGDLSWQEQSRVLTFHQTRIEDSGLYSCIGLKLGVLIFKRNIVLKVAERPLELKSVSFGEQDFGEISAYQCLTTSTKSDIINLSTVGECTRTDFTTYKEPEDHDVQLLIKRYGLDVTVLRCKLSLTVKHSSCGSGFFGLREFSQPHAFVVTERDLYDIQADQCVKAFKTGKLKIILGEAKITMEAKIGKSSSEAYLHGTYVNVKHQCKGSPSGHAIYVNKREPKCTAGHCANRVVHVQLELEMEREKAVINLDKSILEIPRLGISEKLISDNFTLETQQGILTATLSELFPIKECERYGILRPQAGKLYNVREDLSKEQDIPNIMILNIDTFESLGNKTVAFQLNEMITACERKCYKTQIEGILICEAKQNHVINERNEMSDGNRKTLKHIGSFGLNHLQINIASSIGTLLYDICLQRRQIIQQALTNFENMRDTLFLSKGERFKMFKRAETGYILQCEKLMVYPRQTENDFCCTNLPVSYFKNGKRHDSYITPVEHILVEICDFKTCIENLPLTFYTDSGIPVCQNSDGLRVCEAGKILNPDKNIVSESFVPLDRRENVLPESQRITNEQLELLKTEEYTSVNFANSFINTIETNVLRCETENHCITLRYAVQRELARQNSSFTDFSFTYTIFGKFCQFCMWAAAVWVLLNCSVNFVVKVRSSFANYRNNSITLLGIFWIFFSSLDASFNPWSTVRMQHLRRIVELEQIVATLDAKSQTRFMKLETMVSHLQNNTESLLKNVEKLTDFLHDKTD